MYCCVKFDSGSSALLINAMPSHPWVIIGGQRHGIDVLMPHSYVHVRHCSDIRNGNREGMAATDFCHDFSVVLGMPA